MEYVVGYEHHDISLPNRNQSRTICCSDDQYPSRNYQAKNIGQNIGTIFLV